MALLDQFGKPLTLSQHNSIEHAIGEELPAPTIILPSAGVAALGTSSVPAREDHQHSNAIPSYANDAAVVAALGSNPPVGTMVYVQSRSAIIFGNGTKWINLKYLGAWNTYPGVGLTQGVAVAGTVTYSRWIHEGSHVFWKARIDVTGSGTAGSAVVLTPPISGSADSYLEGTVQIYDASTATRYTLQAEFNVGATLLTLGGSMTAGNLWGAVPSIGLASSDQIRIDVSYYALQ